MIHQTSGHGALSAPGSMAFHAHAHGERWPPPPSSTRLSREALLLGIKLRREALDDLAAEMVGACEAAAGSGDPRYASMDARRFWDRAAWRRYLDTAASLERRYGQRMRRLRDDIARLERLLELPVAA